MKKGRKRTEELGGRGEPDRETDRERGTERDREWRGGVSANHLDSVSDKKHLVSTHLITQAASSLFFSQSCVNSTDSSDNSVFFFFFFF